MKKVTILILCFYAINIGAVEMVCSESSYKDKNKINVDCESRFDIIEKLKQSWLLLRQNHIGGQAEELCYEAYVDAKDIHPSIDLYPLVDNFFMRCNMGLDYVD